jgi:hypothetical protein
MNEPRQVPNGVFSSSVSRRLFTQVECAKPSLRQNCPALVRSQVRTIGTHSPMRTGHEFAPKFALLVRSAGVRNCTPLAHPSAFDLASHLHSL